MRNWILALGLLFLPTLVFSQTPLEKLPVQDGGRIKPFDTFAKEALELVWGRKSIKGEEAVDVVLSWVVKPETWADQDFVLIRHSGLREALKLEKQRLHYSPKEIMMNDRFPLLMQDLRNKKDAEEKLDPFFQALQTLENQIGTFHAVTTGLAPGVAPQASSNDWRPISKLEGAARDNFEKIVMAFVKHKAGQGDQQAMTEATTTYVEQLKKEFGENYAPFPQIAAERHYNQFHPFMYSWIFYLFATIFFAVLVFGGSGKWGVVGWVCLGLAFLLHTYGFGLRVYISGRPPVSNMYETVVWVAWGSVLIAVILERFFKMKILLLGASAVATLSLILCDLSSHVLDGSIDPLEPVLRDNFWLITHVLTITLSYAAFFVAFVIGDIVLFLALKNEKKFQAAIASSATAIYRLLQVGVVLLAGGTILGGVWADYSWGRFWGWDPKETWAFIALLGYLAILHGRLVGWLRNFGLAATSILAFSLVIMAWYGVNFVLGAGLHTYGFGAGGVEYVAAFVAAHLIYVAFVTSVRHTRQKRS